MDENTTAEQLRRPSAPLNRRRRSLAAAALLLSVAATVSACGGSSSPKSAAAAASASSSPSGSVAPSAGASSSSAPTASPSSPAGGAAGTPTAPGSGSTPAPTGGGAAPGSATPGSPVKPGAPGTPAPQPPVNPQSQLKPTGYLAKDNQLTVFFFGVVCDKYGLQVDEGRAGTVRAQVVITQHLPVGQMCPALVKQQSVVANLAQPLQGREVVDALTGANIPLESAPNGGPVSAGN
ncbi:hypothetical protein [Kitasatospora sp. GAS204B]|uniref:hypothetical protein n=1 Tax=unclassified Kitasatospora TaxID=2633591 RepID=UPI0024750BF2|nr:hypothetical protein [Kitasatospora sp. GAS204B]MDH6115852.1 hypothetical protein [Kitasatospora sp. GAS204B]